MDGSKKKGGNFFNLLQKEVGTQTGGVPSEKGGPNPEGNYAHLFNHILIIHVPPGTLILLKKTKKKIQWNEYLTVTILRTLLSTLYSKCDQASDVWQQLELASELFFYLLFGCPRSQL